MTTSDDGSDAMASKGVRLDVLEAAEEVRVESKRLNRRFELAEAIILSIAAVLAAWTGFQSAKWSGVQANNYSSAGATRVESAKSADTASKQTTIDVISFTQWLDALVDEGLLETPPSADTAYVPNTEVLSGFLYERFRPEFKTAVDAWLASEPRLDPAAPPTPFAMAEYQLAADAETAELEQRAEGHTKTARQANQRSDNYVLMTIMFATVLFFAGIASKMDTFRARALLVGAAILLLVVSFSVVVSFPVEI